MKLSLLSTESSGRATRRVLLSPEDLKSERLVAGDLVRLTLDGSAEPALFLHAWPSPTATSGSAQISDDQLATLRVGEDEPLPDVSLRKVKMAKAAMREVKLVGLTEVLVEESAVGLSEEEIAREQAWIKVCVREALVDIRHVTRHTVVSVTMPTSFEPRVFRVSSIDDELFSPEGDAAAALSSLSIGTSPEDDSKAFWCASWATDVLLNFAREKGKGKAGASSKYNKVTAASGKKTPASSNSSSVPNFINFYPPTTAMDPTTSGYALLGGLSTQITQIRSMIDLPLLHPDLFRTLSLPPPRGILLHGPPGTGKTALARAIASSSPGCSCIVINGPELSSSFHGETEERLRMVWDEARRREPCIIVVDEVDAICPKREDGGGEVERRVVAQLLTLMDGMGKGDGPEERVVVIGATNRPNAIDPALRRPGRFDKEIEIGVPDAPARLSILQVLLSNVPHSISPESLAEIASKTHGYVGADLSSLVREAGTLAIQSHLSASTFSLSALPALTLSAADLLASLPLVRPSAMREVFIETPTTRWSDIGGQEDVKQKLRECVEWPLLHRDTFDRLGVRPPRGVLLYGPPGCSKTLTAKALATESGINFLAVKGPELLNKYVGESERAVREVFRKARAASPSIIFFDEIDALGTARSDGDSHTDGILTSILNEMDGIEELVGVTVVAATNRPDVIDSALLRPGRIDRILYVGPPSFESRKAIFQLRLAKMAVEPGVSVDELATLTSGCSGAEIVQVCQDAALRAMNADLSAPFVRKEDFSEIVRTVRRRITPEMVSFFEAWRDGSGARSA